MLHSWFDPSLTGKLNPVLLDLEECGFTERGPDSIVTITASGLAQLLKHPRWYLLPYNPPYDLTTVVTLKVFCLEISVSSQGKPQQIAR